MANVYVKTVDGGEDTTPAGTDAIELDDGTTSRWTLLSNLYKAIGSGTQNATTFLRGDGTYAAQPAVDGWAAGAGTWSYSSADDPTFIISINADVTALIGVGDRVKLTQSTGGTKYFIVTVVGAYGGGVTLVTVYGGTDYNLENEAISSPYYSHMKSPFGFPVDPGKWTVTLSDTSSRTQTTPTNDTFYNLGTLTISIPIGLWVTQYSLAPRPVKASGTLVQQVTSLSTANNSASDADFTTVITLQVPTGSIFTYNSVTCIPKVLTIASKTTYYLVAKTTQSDDSIAFRGDASPTRVYARCAYL